LLAVVDADFQERGKDFVSQFLYFSTKYGAFGAFGLGTRGDFLEGGMFYYSLFFKNWINATSIIVHCTIIEVKL